MTDLVTQIKHALLPIVYPARNRLHPRKLHAYAIGLPRTGTHSLKDLFAKHYRALHEPMRREMIDLIYAREIEGLSDDEQIRRLRQRDRQLWLEMEASNHVSIFAPLLAQMYPAAKFILLLRDPYSWLSSMLTVAEEDFIRQPQMGPWREKNVTAKFGYGRLSYGDYDEPMRQRDLAPLVGYIRYWQSIYAHILTRMPTDQLLLVYTHQISSDLERIAQFIGIPVETLDRDSSHKNARAKKSTLIDEIDRNYLEMQVQAICGELMAQYFPTIKHLEDAIKPR
ncbi:MAG: sulfotransferase [Chloroflexota bacterium]|mgnify:CR=1 FL=1|nr:sulfotransferase [Chloroflexota bacterium]